MIKESIKIQNKLGLHARASMELIKVAGRYGSEILIKYRDRELNAKSIMGVMVLGAKLGDTVEFTVSGDDEAAAWAAIRDLINDKFHEE